MDHQEKYSKIENERGFLKNVQKEERKIQCGVFSLFTMLANIPVYLFGAHRCQWDVPLIEKYNNGA